MHTDRATDHTAALAARALAWAAWWKQRIEEAADSREERTTMIIEPSAPHPAPPPEDAQRPTWRPLCETLAEQRAGMLRLAAEWAAVARTCDAEGDDPRARLAAREAAGFLRTADRLARAMALNHCAMHPLAAATDDDDPGTPGHPGTPGNAEESAA